VNTIVTGKNNECVRRRDAICFDGQVLEVHRLHGSTDFAAYQKHPSLRIRARPWNTDFLGAKTPKKSVFQEIRIPGHLNFLHAMRVWET